MVKTFEEARPLLNENQLKTLSTILFRYIKDSYKQFHWEMEFSSQGERIKVKYSNKTLAVIFHIPPSSPDIVRCEAGFYGDLNRQNFSITKDMAPKELGKLVQNMFRLVKTKMEKIE